MKDKILSEYNKRKKQLEEKISSLQSLIKQKEEELQAVKKSFSTEIEQYKSKIAELESDINSLTKALLSEKMYIVEYPDGHVEVTKNIFDFKPLSVREATDIYHLGKYPSTWERSLREKAITKEDVCEWLELKHIPEDIYKELRTELQPLPKICYVNYDEGIAWAQMHIRGLDIEDTKKYLDGKMSFSELIQGHSIHVDLRMKFKDAFVQWVITQDHIPDYFDTIIGRRDPKTGNASKGLAIVKPSAEEPTQTVKAKEDLIIGPEDAKLIEKYVLFDKSYIIEAGDVGATAYKNAYMCAIWIGKVKAGVQRPDLHEYFLYPSSDMPKRNQELFNGRFIIRCFKADNDKRWWVWKAYDDPYPMDSILHADCGHYYPIKAEKIDKFGREAYREMSVKKFAEKLSCEL